MPRKPIIGIVGSIGAGKSVVAAEMTRLGGHLISADLLGHEGLRDPGVKAQVSSRFGQRILGPDGEIDRGQLAGIVFVDANELRALEAIQFPYIGGRVQEEIAKAESSAAPFVVLDAAVLFEAGWKDAVDRIVFVDAPREVRLQRLRQNRRWPDGELERRERSQMPLEEKRRAADAVLVNAGSVEDVAVKVRELLRDWNALPENAGGC